MNLNKYWQKIMFAKNQYQNENQTINLTQIGDMSSKWNHANDFLLLKFRFLAQKSTVCTCKNSYIC